MRWQHIKTIFWKEMTDTVRDRKTLYVMILVPLILMPALMLIGPLMGQREAKKTEAAIYTVALRGSENSPELASFLKKSPRLKTVASTNPDADLKKGIIQVAITIPAGFDAAVGKETKTAVTLSYEGTKQISNIAKLQVSELIDAYGKKLVAERLAKRGLAPGVLEPMTITERNMASEEEMGGMFLSFIIPMIVVIWAIVGGMYTAIDVGAGEKERGTLESLLVTPPDRKAVVLGKFLTVLTVAMVTIVLALVSMLLSLQLLLPNLVKEAAGPKLSLPLSTAAIVLGLAFLITCFASALELSLSTYARSFKEAQNYITPLYLAVMLPAFFVQFTQTFKPPEAIFLVPILNAMLVFKELFIGDIVINHIVLTVISTIVCILLALLFTFKIFNREKVLFRT